MPIVNPSPAGGSGGLAFTGWTEDTSDPANVNAHAGTLEGLAEVDSDAFAATAANAFQSPFPTTIGTSCPQLVQLSPVTLITSGTLPSIQFVSGTAQQVLANIGGQDTGDVELHTPVTFTPGVATTATCIVALSPDNTTFTTLVTLTKPVGTVFDGTIEDAYLRVPFGWWVKYTVVNATLGLSHFY